MKAAELLLEVSEVNSLNDAFWVNWLDDFEGITQSITALCYVKRFRGDPRDVLHETMLIAYDRFQEFQRSKASFKTWVIWIARSYISKLYATDKLPMMQSIDDVGDDGTMISEAIPDGAIPVEMVVIGNENSGVFADYVISLDGSSAKVAVLNAMATLIEMHKKLSTRNIAELVGFSHTTVAKTLKDIRKDLEEMGVQDAESDFVFGCLLWPDSHYGRMLPDLDITGRAKTDVH